MQDGGLAQRYAQALFGAALAREALEQVGGDLQALLDFDEGDASFRLFLESPQVRDDHKHSLIDTVLESRAHALTAHFIHLLLDKKRMPILRETARAFDELLRAHQGVVQARVTTAIVLDGKALEELRKSIEARTGKSIVLEAKTDEKILGGTVVQWGDQILDDTVRTRLEQIREQLLAVGV